VSEKSSLPRRELLRRGVQLGTIATGALAASLVLDDCGDHTPTTTTPSTTAPTTTTTIATPTPPSAQDWTRLASSLQGTLVQPSNPAYGVDRLLYNSKFTDLYPRAIAYCESADDVARCISFVADHDVALAARSGGHSYGAYSSCRGLVIDVSRLAAIAVDTTANVAHVGAGAQLIDVYNEIGSRDRLLPGGSCPTVGIAGLALGGGIGVFARRYGMTCDNLRSVSLVTADARSITADRTNHSDLFWASQGGGGGNFGVATSFEFDVHSMPVVTLFTLQYPWAAADTVLHAWQEWISTTPDEVWSNCLLQSQGQYGYLAQIAGVYCGTPTALASLLSPLKAAIATAPTYSFSGSNDYLSAMQIEAGCAGLTIAACHVAPESPHGALSRTAYTAKSSYVDGPMTASQVTSMVAAVERLKAEAPYVGGGLAFDAYGGVINTVGPGETAFVHRNKLACIQASYSWSSLSDTSEIAAGEQWLSWLGAEVFNPSTGAYQNYIDPTLMNWQRAYYGSNLERLVTIKQQHDPDNRFSFAQSIPLSL
jgi:FAD binding domain/Berberine and berberine like